MSNLLLEGNVDDDRGQLIEQLQEDVVRLETELHLALNELSQVKGANARAISALRRQLAPLYQALKSVFGEMEVIAGVDEGEVSAVPQKTAAVWASWKSRLGGSAAKVIDALLLHNNLNTQQLAIATGLHRTTIPKIIYELNKAGLINKNSGRFSLKEL